jgi:hypothetical protein
MLFNIFKQWLTGSSEVEGTKSVQPNPSSVAPVINYSQYEIKNTENENQYSDKYFQVAPVGFSIPNPVNMEITFPRQQTIIRTPDVRTSSAPKGSDCK